MIFDYMMDKVIDVLRVISYGFIGLVILAAVAMIVAIIVALVDERRNRKCGG